MTETILSSEHESPKEETEKVGFFKRTFAKYPRLSRVVAAFAAALAVIGVVTAVKSSKESNDSAPAGELNSSGDSTVLDTETHQVTES